MQKFVVREEFTPTTRFQQLADGLDVLKRNWGEVADIQANWIGKCDVYRFLLDVYVS